MKAPAAVAVHDPWVERAETLARRFASARDVATLAQLAQEIRAIAAAMIEDDAGGGILGRTLAALNDALAVRAIGLAAAHHRLPAASWCWLAMGSEGRREQTFVTDQDNGIIFAAADHAEARSLRPLLLAFAGEANAALAECGFPLCDGGIMAGQEGCCLSLAEWRERFVAWVRTPDPQALLNATIFFDFRPLLGEARLAAELRGFLAEFTRGADPFLRMLAGNALAAEPPLGKVRDFVVEDGRIDLKKFGSRLFVDAARILGIGAPDPATAARLRHGAAAGRIAAGEAEAAVHAFHHLQRVRLQRQHLALAGGQAADNRIDPDALNDFDRRVLLEALKQARLLQQRLKTLFRLEG
jgi:CBS domain-containing protein